MRTKLEIEQLISRQQYFLVSIRVNLCTDLYTERGLLLYEGGFSEHVQDG